MSMAFKSDPSDAVKSSLAFKQSLDRTKSIQGAIGVKKKRLQLQKSHKALQDDNLAAWAEANKRKRIISGPLSRLKKCSETIKKVQNAIPQVDDAVGSSGVAVEREKKRRKKTTITISTQELVSMHKNISRMLASVDEAINGVAPIAMALQKCYEKQKDIEERLKTITAQGAELDKALMKGCQSVFNNEPNWLYANEDFIKQILPASMHQQTSWVKNKREEKKKSATGTKRKGTMHGNTAGNASSKKPTGKVEINAKRLANKERQDMPDSIVRHTPVAAADPYSYTGLAGSMTHQNKNKAYIKRT